MKSLLATTVLVATLSGCTNIYFDNGSAAQANKAPATEQWHHNFAAALYEGSEPVDLSEECPDSEWQTVHTYKSFTNGLAEAAVNQVGPIWYPKTVEISCAQVPYKPD
ncbi:Bor family protein [Pseudoalteromonas sp. ACER1]|jgi:hypothetical protein|uniref:Lipoprotein n=1 Tax=Pseudoalteromonas lipolytica TaxID=570156 RepID=A0A0P7E2V8_9GAMM|nr:MULTISPECIES: hypothetical protein [Pseudoalteromonas]MED5514920.1 hypothetical protein [Pseudomonadota bacterium]KPM81253.1 hypothetical protein AOG27_18130 [Pseudoalteromonas lipolytica]MBC7008687.1 hypothetical protein [Pseudoalteromonas sp. BZK2]MCF2847580.1 Bor family protein [Pseudoalteromonas sp. PAST1]MCF2917066.1 Bor family protein [Pseudoalteromonas sp. Cn5-37]|tara:strand:- start:768 stop:1091 length:324 start_codon:yes stop_codon:yes gene_type:complete